MAPSSISRISKSNHGKKDGLKLSNFFGHLEEEKCLMEEDELPQSGLFVTTASNSGKLKKTKISKVKSETASSKKIRKGYRKFESKNFFDVLRENPEEDLTDIIARNKVLSSRKQSLKKCKKCNFKSRSCILDPSSCKAAQSQCSKCKKLGHFPQSSNCKSQRHTRKRSVSNPTLINTKSIKNTDDILLLLNKRIKQLESLMKLQTANLDKKVDQHSLHHKIPLDLIPFFLMYVFLNHDKIMKFDDKLKRFARKQSHFSTKDIIKSASQCARKFINESQMKSENKFVRYCNKKVDKLLGRESSQSIQNNEGILNILRVYDEFYYKSEINGQDDVLNKESQSFCIEDNKEMEDPEEIRIEVEDQMDEQPSLLIDDEFETLKHCMDMEEDEVNKIESALKSLEVISLLDGSDENSPSNANPNEGATVRHLSLEADRD